MPERAFSQANDSMDTSRDKWDGKPGTYGQRADPAKYVGPGKGDSTGSYYRAKTPQEAQKSMAKVDADDMRKAANGVAGAIPSYHKGGIVKKTGLAKVHKGEKVIPRNKVKEVTKKLKKTAGGKR